MTRRALLAVTLCVLSCTPTSTSTDTAADEQAIRSTLDGWNQALTSTNDSLLATFYAENSVMMPPGAPRVTGRENIRAFWATLWPLQGSLAMAPVRFTISTDLAVEEGNWTWTARTAGGERRDHGKYVQTWHRIDGAWLIATDIWNSDLAPEVAASIVKP